MADFVITAANVIPSSTATIVTKVASAAVTRGQSLYLDANGQVNLFKANGVAPVNVFFGIALDDAAINQTVAVVTYDTAFQPGYTIAAGGVAIGSGANAGGSAPIADLTTGWFLNIIGLGIGGNKIALVPTKSGVPT